MWSTSTRIESSKLLWHEFPLDIFCCIRKWFHEKAGLVDCIGAHHSWGNNASILWEWHEERSWCGNARYLQKLIPTSGDSKNRGAVNSLSGSVCCCASKEKKTQRGCKSSVWKTNKCFFSLWFFMPYLKRPLASTWVDIGYCVQDINSEVSCTTKHGRLFFCQLVTVQTRSSVVAINLSATSEDCNCWPWFSATTSLFKTNFC